MSEQYEPREDGICARCGRNAAKTHDGRFCKGCLKTIIREKNPGVTRFKTNYFDARPDYNKGTRDDA